MVWCESNDVDYVCGLARNPRLEHILEPAMTQAAKARRADRQAGTSVQGLSLSDAGQLGPRAPGDRQGGVGEGGRQPSVCGHLAEPG